MELKWIFYITTNILNGYFYFGVHRTNPNINDGYIGCGIYRQSDANKIAKNNNQLALAVKKYGYNNFKRTTIKIFPDTEEGKEIAYWYESIIVNEILIKNNMCYNTATGGEFGGIISYKKVYKYDLSNNFIKCYSSVKEAALDVDNVVNINSCIKSIRNCCLNKTKTSFGFIWSYKKLHKKTYKQIKKVGQYSLNGELLKIWNSVKEAENSLNIKNIHSVVAKSNKNKTAGGYIWKYYIGEKNIEKLNNKRLFSRIEKIDMYDKFDNFIKTYDCIKDCIKEYPNLKVSQIVHVINGKIKSTFGYKFKKHIS